jgi:hypothetical protein
MTSLSDKYKDSLPFDSSNVTTITSNYTALNNDVVFVNTASSALTVTLPASPTAGSKIKVLDVAANAQNNIITVLGNGYNVGGASAYIIDTPDSSVDLIYINSNKGWNIFNKYVSLTKPGIPISVSAIDVGTARAYNDGAATITFTPSTTGDPADLYTVTSTPGNFTASGVSSPIVVTGLQSNTSYTFTVSATNSSGTAVSSSSSSITATTVPQAPTISTVQYGYEQLAVNYTAGATGGKAVSAYTATRTGAVTASGNSPIAFTSLTGGTAYTISMIATNANGNSIASNSVVQTPFTASGGTTSTSGSYRIHSFTGSSNFVLTGNTVNCEYLVVAGGGSGGSWYGGGGGAGGMRSTSSNITPTTYSVVVGAGGNSVNNSTANDGNASSFNLFSSTGGGGGGFVNSTGGRNGGSGGGGAGGNGTGGGGSGVSGQGSNGGSGYPSHEGGGGGGAGGAGGSGPGGVGSSSAITGTSIFYAGGGGGSNYYSNNNRAGGNGGGGAGGYRQSSSGVSGTANTGGGGGGGSETGTGSGGSGIVIIRYLTTVA